MPSGSRQPSRSGHGQGTRYAGTPTEVRALGAFIKLLRAAHWASAKAAKRREEAGFTENQFGVLEALLHVGPLDQAELTTKLLTSPSNLTLVIDNLSRAGHVRRRPDPRDRRRRVVHLTAKGRRAVERVFPAHVARIVEVMDGLTANEQEQLSHLTRKLGRWAAALS